MVMTSRPYIPLPSFARIVPELLQDDVRPDYIFDYTIPYFIKPDRRAATIKALRDVREMLGGPGASRRTAGILADLID